MIFLSYSHKDQRFADELLRHLEPHLRGDISVWTDQRIRPGKKWRDEIERALSRSKIILLLVSPDYLASDFIADEELPYILSKAHRGDAPVFWCLVRECVYRLSPIAEYQAIHDVSKPLASLSRPAREKVYSEIGHLLMEVSARSSTTVKERRPDDGVGIATRTGVKSGEIEITIARDFDKFSDAEQESLLNAIRALINVPGANVRIIAKRKGSVRLTLELTQEEAEELYLQAKEGKLTDHMVLGAKLIGADPPEQNQAFVVMKFGDEALDSAYEGVVRPLLSDFGFAPLRIDEIQDSGKISQQVLYALRRSAVIVADLSGERPNCYYEAGFAHAMGKAIIFSIRKGERIHFDLADHRFIEWTTEADLRKKLRRRLEALTGRKT